MKFFDNIRTDQRGISGTAILIFAVFVLSIVLVNGIMINVNNQKRAQVAQAKIVGFDVANNLCGKAYNSLTPECTISMIASCGSYFLVKSNCSETDPVLLNAGGEVLGVCSDRDGAINIERCEKLLDPYTLKTCLVQNNICF